MEYIPDELKVLKQWTISFSKEERKRPKHSKYKPNGAWSMETALREVQEGMLTGMFVTFNDPYILGDIDHVTNPNDPFAELPIALASFIQETATYYEVSPSGQGIRFILRLPSADLKADLDGNVFYTHDMEDKRSCQINIGPPWMTITGNPTIFSENRLAEVTLEQLGEIFELKYRAKKEQDLEEKVAPATKQSKLPSLTEVTTHLLTLPLDQNPRILRAYEKTFNSKYEHYDYWLKVLMALHDYASRSDQKVECLEVAIRWSMKDPAKFTGDKDVADRWKSFNRTEGMVSYKTLFRLYYHYVLRWPRPKRQTKEDKQNRRPVMPLTTEYVNFRALCDHFDIKLWRNVHNSVEAFVTCDEDLRIDYFIGLSGVYDLYGKYCGPLTERTLTPAFHILCQDHGFVGISHGQVRAFVMNFLAETNTEVDPIRDYLDTPLEELPERYQIEDNLDQAKNTSFEALFACLKLDYMTAETKREEALYKLYYRAWLMGIIRSIYYPNSAHMNNAILLLTGPEQTRKTSHFRYMFPPCLKQYLAMTTHTFATPDGMRDIAKLSATNILVVWDELEHYLDAKSESNFKKILDNNPQKIIDKYEVLEKLIQPIAIYGATSNQREFKLGNEGSRRIFHIPVKWVATDKMEKICWHKLFRDLKTEVDNALARGNVPWLLTEEQLQYQRVLHGQIRAKTNLDLLLEEVFAFDGPCESLIYHLRGVTSFQGKGNGLLMTTKQIAEELIKHGGNQMAMSRPALIKTLERLCGEFTGTQRKREVLDSPKCEIYKGQAYQNHYKKWVMPEIRSEFMRDKFIKG